VGSTRHGLLTPTYAAAIDSLDAAPSAPRRSALQAVGSPTSGDSTFDFDTSRSRFARRANRTTGRGAHRSIGAHDSRRISRADRARVAPTTTICGAEQSSRSLLLPHAGRHALDEPARANARGQACRSICVRAVKNLRFVGSAVLLLNFREVRDFHFCSISVAM
jgi:hypothetical protein